MVYRLCYIDDNKAWFTNDFKNQWGDDWDDKPYEHNAGEPYDNWLELIEDSENILERKYKRYEINLKTIYFEPNDYSVSRPCDNYYYNSPYSVEEINKKVVPWLHSDNFDIFAGTTLSEFKRIIKKYGGSIYILDK